MSELSHLKPAWFHILLVLANGAQHGYAIRKEVEERTGGAIKLWPATLYGSIRELSERGVIESLDGEDDPNDDRRRRYYQLTESGRTVLSNEAERLQRLVDVARTSKALA